MPVFKNLSGNFHFCLFIIFFPSILDDFFLRLFSKYNMHCTWLEVLICLINTLSSFNIDKHYMYVFDHLFPVWSWKLALILLPLEICIFRITKLEVF